MEGLRPVTCAVCRECIGVYEPLVLVANEVPRQTSLAREPQLSDSDSVLLHAGCFDGSLQAG